MIPNFSPTMQDFSPETHTLGVPDVSDQVMAQYGQMMQQQMGLVPDPNEVLMHARLEKIWLQVGKEYKILTGNKKHDNVLWEAHQLFVQGAPDVEDPIMSNERARGEFMKRAMKVVGEE